MSLHFDMRLSQFTQFWPYLTNLHYERTHIPANRNDFYDPDLSLPSLTYCFLIYDMRRSYLTPAA